MLVKPTHRRLTVIISLITIGIPMVIWGFRQQSGPRTGEEQDWGWLIFCLGIACISTGLFLRTKNPVAAVGHGVATPAANCLLLYFLVVLAFVCSAWLVELGIL